MNRDGTALCRDPHTFYPQPLLLHRRYQSRSSSHPSRFSPPPLMHRRAAASRPSHTMSFTGNQVGSPQLSLTSFFFVYLRLNKPTARPRTSMTAELVISEAAFRITGWKNLILTANGTGVISLSLSLSLCLHSPGTWASLVPFQVSNGTPILPTNVHQNYSINIIGEPLVPAETGNWSHRGRMTPRVDRWVGALVVRS